MTGKGFPDFATRELLKALVEREGLKAVFLGDFDPHAVFIFLTYAWGSKAFESQSIACRELTYLGVFADDVEELQSQLFLPLSSKDHSMFNGLKTHPASLQFPKLMNEIVKMESMGAKCEVEALIAQRSLISISAGERHSHASGDSAMLREVREKGCLLTYLITKRRWISLAD